MLKTSLSLFFIEIGLTMLKNYGIKIMEVFMETRKIVLTSLDKEKYPDKEIECVFIEDMQQYVQYLLENGAKVGYAQKKATVTARVGIVGEEVDTRPRVERDGKTYVIGETKGKVKVEGSMVVKNPDGEEYIVKPDKFESKYRETEEKGVYKPTDGPIKYVVADRDIAYIAPWGEPMFVLEGGILNISNLDDVYGIQNSAFEKTYTEIKNDKIK